MIFAYLLIMRDIMDKIALITGASKGIGKSFAEVFAKNGYSLILIARTLSELQQLQTELNTKYQCKSTILSIDLSHDDAVDQIINNITVDLPNIDVLINNAGFGISKKFSDTSETDIDGMLAVNINILTKLTYRILPHMLIKKSGKILNVSSTAAYTPGPFMSIYYASKAYVSSFSESLYEEYKKDGITVSALCPGVTRTSFHERAGHSLLFSGVLPIMSSDTVAEIAYHGLMKNKRTIIPGIFNMIAIFIMSLTPNCLLAKITAKLNKA